MTITIVGGGNPSGPTFPVQRSVRLRSSASAYFARTPASAGNRKTWTWSAWVKRGALGTLRTLFGINVVQNDSQAQAIFFGSDDKIYVTPWTNNNFISNAVFRDPSAWYHIVVAFDSTNATANNRVIVYVNGVNQSGTYPLAVTLNADYGINQAGSTRLGDWPAAGFSTFDGYLTEVNFIDGQALTPASFGAYNNYGVWSPAKYTGTYGTNGFYLPFTTNTSSETLGLDYANTNPELITNGMFTANVTGWTVTPGTGGSPSITWQSAHTARLANINAFGATYYQAIPTVIGQTYYAQCYTSNISLGGSTRVAQMIKGDNVNFSTNLVVIGSVQQSAGAGGIRNTFVATATTTYIGIQADIGGVSGSADFTQISVALGGYKNSWNPFNISTTAGVTYDSMLDVPTLTSSTNANYAVGNPLNADGSTWSGGNLNFSLPNSTNNAQGTVSVTSGKWYWEVVYSAQANGTGVQEIGLRTRWTSGVVYAPDGTKYVNGTSSAYGAAYAVGDIIGVALDMDGGTVTFYKNNTSQGSISLSGSGCVNATFTTSAGGGSTSTGSVNFGQRPFTHPVPSGFKSLNTYNLPAPTIPNGAAYMAATTYTGTGATQSITNTVNGTSLQPDFVWIKSRNNIGSHQLIDSVRGIPLFMFSDATTGDTSRPNSFTSFNSNGFTVGSSSDGNTNLSTYTYVGWQWKAGGTPAVVNTSGSIPSTISANTTSGFSILTYTGTGANATVGHGLGVAPKMVIVKWRTGGTTESWAVYHASLGATNYLSLNTTNASAAGASLWNNTSPTSTVVTIGTDTWVNGSTRTYVAYCWAEIPGFSKFGSYTGNGSADGPFVYTGFRPRFILAKRTSAVSDWWLYDTSRNTYNVISTPLFADLSNAEGNNAVYNLDLLSNGFKWRTADTTMNGSGSTYIYAAFAENPFNYSLAR